MNQPITSPRIALLSFAHYHANFWAEVFRERGLLHGIWDDDEARGREAAARFGAAYFADLEALLAESTAAAVTCENSRHAELIERAAAHGLAVFVEKPLAGSMADARRIEAAVKRTGITLVQSFPKRQDPVSHWLRGLVKQGELGRLQLVRIRHGHYYGLLPDFRNRWYVKRALGGGGALLDEGVHGADLLAWLFGMPVSVMATVSDAALGLEVEDLGIATFEFASGMVAELTASFCFAAADTSIELYGSRGTALVSAVDLASRDVTRENFVRICRRDLVAAPDAPPAWETVPLVPQFKRGQFHQQGAAAFVDCLVNGSAPAAGLAEGINALAMIEAAYESARAGGRRVPVPAAWPA
jgi:predicted dehydrogenase